MFRAIFGSALSGVGRRFFHGASSRVRIRIPLTFVSVGVCTLLAHAESEEYIGEKRRGLQHGQGTMVYKDGSTYSGAWKAGKKDGEGSLYAVDGTVFSGHWEDDVLWFSEIKYPNGDKYIGRISNFKPHGNGTMYFSKGDFTEYSGCFKDGLFFGKGELHERPPEGKYASKRAFDGLFRDGKRHGYVVTRDSKNVVIAREIWENDVPVRKLE